MNQQFTSQHFVDENKNPAGGLSEAVGIKVQWQNGPLKKNGVQTEPNGAFVETVLNIAKDRILFYQGSRFACADNAEALEHITKAIEALNRRTADRTKRGVEGTHEQ